MDCIERAKIVEALQEFYSVEEAVEWIFAEQKLLDGRRAIDCSATEVWRLIEQLRSGAYI